MMSMDQEDATIKRLMADLGYPQSHSHYRAFKQLSNELRHSSVENTWGALEPVEGNLLPPVGSHVLIHLNGVDAWVKHTVTGYYVWGDLGGAKNLHRVFVRVVDNQGGPNARLLSELRPVESREAQPAPVPVPVPSPMLLKDWAIERAEAMTMAADMLLKAIETEDGAVTALTYADESAEPISLGIRFEQAKKNRAYWAECLRRSVYEFRWQREQAASGPAPLQAASLSTTNQPK